ncbi:YciI family protein [Nocardia sp. NPDC058518]|uniref:YciI family protein n=1 Tax=Nocardia sp. NPDC058518 TaxID=3346534 RepID=UPI003659E773
MTQYLFSVVIDASVYDIPREEAQASYDATEKFNDELRAEGAWVFAGGLGRPDEATVVDSSGADVVVTDGPFVETKEVLGGFWVIEAADLDAAMKIAARASKACEAKIEIRTFDGA